MPLVPAFSQRSFPFASAYRIYQMPDPLSFSKRPRSFRIDIRLLARLPASSASLLGAVPTGNVSTFVCWHSCSSSIGHAPGAFSNGLVRCSRKWLWLLIILHCLSSEVGHLASQTQPRVSPIFSAGRARTSQGFLFHLAYRGVGQLLALL